jgi:superfamily II DNA/RNA helicase
MTFETLGLSDGVLKAVTDAGYDEPTPIQSQAIPVVLMGRDVLGCAQTGTGKTAGFVLPMIDILAEGRAKARMPRSLIVEPTRELADQVGKNFEIYGANHKLTKALLIGGESFTDQERLLNRGVDVLIATPGRLLDLFERGKILLSDVKILVIDEADRMLDMGFIPDVERIVSLLPKIRQTLFFSATMPPEIRRLADAFLMNPKEISVSPPATAAETVDDFLAIVPSDDWLKRDALRKLLKTEEVKNALIFCNRKRDVDTLFKSLAKHGFNAAALHGDMAQASRTETLQRFRDGEITYLVASDVAARGLDIRELSHVFNFDVPYNAEDYVHRIGRTGRAGRNGRAFTIAFPEDGKFVSAITKLIGRAIPPVEIEGIETQELSEDDRPRRGRGRGPARGREARGGKPRRQRSPRGQGAEVRGKDTEAHARDTERKEERADTPSPARAPEPVAEKAIVSARSENGRKRGRRGDDKSRIERERRRERKPEPVSDHSGPGMGDHTPAFLNKPVNVDG